VRDTGGAALMGWAVTVYLVPGIVSGSLAAALKQRLGARLVLLLCGLMFLAGTLVAAGAPSMPVILLGRAMQGAGDGAIAALCYALVPALFPPGLIARVFGVEAMVWAASAFGAPLASGWLTELVSWRAAFLANLPMIAGFLLLIGRVAPRGGGEGPAPVPLARLSMLAAGIMLVAVTDILGGVGARLALLVAAGLLLAGTVLADRRHADPLFPRDMLRLGTKLGTCFWIVLLMPLGQAVVGVYLALGLQRVWHLGPGWAGSLVTVMSLSWSAAGLAVAGTRRARLSLARFGPAMNAAGLLCLCLAFSTHLLALVPAGQLLIGTGFGLCWAWLSEAVIEAAPPGERDRASAMLPTVQSAGYAIGAAVAGLVGNVAGLPHLLEAGAPVAGPMIRVFAAGALLATGAVLVRLRI